MEPTIALPGAEASAPPPASATLSPIFAAPDPVAPAAASAPAPNPAPGASVPPPPQAPPSPPPPPRFTAPPAPPYNPPPQVVFAPAPPSPPRRGTGWKVFAVFLLIALMLSMVGNMASCGRGFTSAGRGVHHKRQFMEEILLEDNNSANRIAIVTIEGVITSGETERTPNMVESVRDQFKLAARDSAVKAVVLKVNSPGGEVLASDEIYQAIQAFQRSTGKPVIASMQTMAASGGYYVAAPCRWIVANELTITGSIGVIMHGFNMSGLMKKIGVQQETYKSGKHKDMLSPFRDPGEISEEERMMVQGLIMETYEKFTNIVETGRSESYASNSKRKDKGQPLDDSWADYADGRIVSGKQAHELGFVDELGDFRAAIDRAEEIAGISDADLIEYRQPFDISDLFRFWGKSEAPTVKIDVGVNFPRLQPGCLYFIYRQAVP